jgi:hypothetical protein
MISVFSSNSWRCIAIRCCLFNDATSNSDYMASNDKWKKGKAILVTGRGGPQGFETSRIPRFLDSRLKDDGEDVSLTRRPLFTPQEDSWYSYLLEAK